MGEKMTLEQVRDYHYKIAMRHESAGSDREAYEKHIAMSNAIDARLATPAQTVDVEAVKSVIASIEAAIEAGAGYYNDGEVEQFSSWQTRLSQAIGDKT
jgi:hypothetical protein